MRSGTVIGLLVFLVVCSLADRALEAGWQKDGFPIAPNNGSQGYQQMVSDGAGGAIVVWADSHSGTLAVYVQRVDAQGTIMWAAEGVPVSSQPYQEDWPCIASDGSGGAIVIWQDYCGEKYFDFYAQRIDANGSVMWDARGVPVCSGPFGKGYPQIVSDGSGGAVFVWMDGRNGPIFDVYAQRVGANGSMIWPPDGVPVCMAPGDQVYPWLVSDGSGGAIITWQDRRAGDFDKVYAQRVGANGSAAWTQDGVAVCPSREWQDYLEMVSDNAGGAIIAFHAADLRGNTHVFAQRIDSTGTMKWAPEGLSIRPAADSDDGYNMIADGLGGAIFAMGEWGSMDYKLTLHAQRMDSNGSLLWTPKGVTVSTLEKLNYAQLVSDGAGGAIIAYSASVYGGYGDPDILVQRVEANGAFAWPVDKMAVCAMVWDQVDPFVLADGSGGAIISWLDYRTGSNYVYVQKVTHSGEGAYEPPPPGPRNVEVRDVPRDQGGRVTVTWDAAAFDMEPRSGVEYYSVWRMLSPAQTAALCGEGKALKGPAQVTKGYSGQAFFLSKVGGVTYGWEWLVNMDAKRLGRYTYTAATLYDSTAADPGWHKFLVMAHAGNNYYDAAYWKSEPDSGYSIDNLAPSIPTGFSGMGTVSETPRGLKLLWNANKDPDVLHYSIYKGIAADFIPSATNCLGSTTENSYLDPSWTTNDRFFYKLAAVDIHGNVGPCALLNPADISVGVLLQGYAASCDGGAIKVEWTLYRPVDKSAQRILRSSAPDGDFTELSREGIRQDDLKFSFEDRSVDPGTTYKYRVEVEGAGGERGLLLETEGVSTPSMPLKLFQNHPNPFNPSTAIDFYLPEENPVTLEIYDASGRLISRLLDRVTTPRGMHSVRWQGLDDEARAASSGVYFYRLRTEGKTISKKMVLLR